VPVKGGAPAGRYTNPTSSLRIKVDGRCTSYFEWLGAGRYRADKEGGVMTAGHKSLLEQIFFGYDQKSLCLRIDLHDEPVLKKKEKAGALTHLVSGLGIHFPELKLQLQINPTDIKKPEYVGDWEGSAEAEIAWDEMVEIKIPFAALGVKEGQELSFYVDVSEPDRATERYPRACTLQFAVPPENVHEHEWMA
jgi:hypothetical protein